MLLLPIVQGPVTPVPEPPADSQEANIMRRFDDLPVEEQERIAKEIVEQMLAKEHPMCEHARKLLDDRRLRNVSMSPQTAFPLFDADEFAPALELKTKKLTTKSKKHKSLRERYLPHGLVSYAASWSWDYGSNSLRTPTAAKPRDVVLSMLYGRWPSHGRLAAYAEGALDRDKDFDITADYFDHTYRDRDGNVYTGIRLFEMWNSQLEFGISDVEAIAFLQRVDDNDNFVSPIPAKNHRGIYKRIKQQFERYREYHDLREVLARRYLDPAGPVPRIYEEVIPELDAAWVLMGHSTRRMASFLDQNPTRKAFLAAVAKRKPKPGQEPTEGPGFEHAQARATLPGVIREHALDFLYEEGLLGFHRR